MKLLAAPFVLLLAIVVGLLKLIVGLSTFVLGLLAALLLLLAFPMLFSLSVAGGLVLIVLAFLISPSDRPGCGRLLACLQGLYTSLRRFLLS